MFLHQVRHGYFRRYMDTRSLLIYPGACSPRLAHPPASGSPCRESAIVEPTSHTQWGGAPTSVDVIHSEDGYACARNGMGGNSPRPTALADGHNGTGMCRGAEVGYARKWECHTRR